MHSKYADIAPCTPFPQAMQENRDERPSKESSTYVQHFKKVRSNHFSTAEMTEINIRY